MKQLLQNIALEQSQLAKLYAGTLNQSATPKRARRIRAGIYGIIKGDSITYIDEQATVTTSKLSEIK